MPLRYDNFANPFKGNSAFSVKPKMDELKKEYFDKYIKTILCSCVYNEHYDRYTFFFKVPSSGNDKYPVELMYDVILEFNPAKNDKKAVQSKADLTEYDIYIYSNSPSFIFTFDYVTKTQYGFPHCIGWSHLSKVAITKPPVIRNTLQIMTIEKTTWMCFFHLMYNGYLNKELIKTLITTGRNENFYMKSVRTQPEKLKEIKDLNDLKKANREKERLKREGKQIDRDFKKSPDNPFKTNFKFDFTFMQNKKLKRIEKRNDKNIFKSNMFTNFKSNFKK